MSAKDPLTRPSTADGAAVYTMRDFPELGTTYTNPTRKRGEWLCISRRRCQASLACARASINGRLSHATPALGELARYRSIESSNGNRETRARRWHGLHGQSLWRTG